MEESLAHHKTDSRHFKNVGKIKTAISLLSALLPLLCESYSLPDLGDVAFLCVSFKIFFPKTGIIR